MKKIKRFLSAFLILFMLFVFLAPMHVEAKSAKNSIKKVSLFVGKNNVTKRTYTVKQGASVKLQAKITPAKAKKSVSYKSSKKKIVTISKKGKIKAKKIGTSKISVTVKGKNGKKKTTWVKIKVVNKLPVTQKPIDSKPSDLIVSREEFVSNLMDTLNLDTSTEISGCPYTDISSSPYKLAIQNAWANGYLIKETTSFLPKNPCTKEFAVATAVLAMGYVDEDNISLSCSDAAFVDEKYRSLIEIALEEDIVALVSGKFEPATRITKSAENQLLSVVSILENKNPVTEEKVNIDYAENVCAVSTDDIKIVLPGDGQAEVTLSSEDVPKDLKQNGYFLAENNGDYMQRAALRVEQIDQQRENTIVSGTVVNDFTEIADTLQISGTADVANGIFIPEEGISLDTEIEQTVNQYSDMKTQAVKLGIGSDGKISVKIDKKIGKNGKVAGSASFKPTIEYDIEWKDGSFKKLYLVMDSELKTSVKADVSNELSIPLGVIHFPLPGLGMGCTISLDLIIKCSGEVSITASAEYQSKIGYNRHMKITNKCTKTNIDFSGCIEGTVGPEIDAMITFFGCELSDIGAEGGVKLAFKRTLQETGLICDDASGSLYLNVFVGKRSPVMKKFGLTYTQKLIDDGKCIFKLGSKNILRRAVHYEDGKKVKKCTYGTGNEDKPDSDKDSDKDLIPAPDPAPAPDEDRGMPENPQQPVSAEDEWSGDYVYFGQNQKLKWKVLENDGESLLLLADNSMGTRAYQDVGSLDGYDNTWENSTLREFLNTEFLDLTFTEEEQEYLLINQVKNGQTEGQIDSGIDTEDKVYLLSFTELKNTSWGFYSGNGAANSRKFKDSANSGSWTRTLSHTVSYGGIYAIWVDEKGEFQTRGAWFTHPITWSKCLYPVIKISLDCPYWSMDGI